MSQWRVVQINHDTLCSDPREQPSGEIEGSDWVDRFACGWKAICWRSAWCWLIWYLVERCPFGLLCARLAGYGTGLETACLGHGERLVGWQTFESYNDHAALVWTKRHNNGEGMDMVRGLKQSVTDMGIWNWDRCDQMNNISLKCSD